MILVTVNQPKEDLISNWNSWKIWDQLKKPQTGWLMTGSEETPLKSSTETVRLLRPLPNSPQKTKLITAIREVDGGGGLMGGNLMEPEG